MDSDLGFVLDVLYERDRGARRSCFTVNQAGLRLLQSSPRHLPAIEQVLRETVEPMSIRGGVGAGTFPGLDYVLGAYLVLGARSDPERVVGFLSTLSPPLLLEAVRNIPVFFASEGLGYSPGVRLGNTLNIFLDGLRESGGEQVKAVVGQVMEKLKETGDEPGRS